MPGESQSRKWFPAWALVAAAALILFAAYTTWEMRRADREMLSLQQRAAQELRRSQALASDRRPYLEGLKIVAAPGTTKFALASKNSTWPAITAYWNPKMGLVLAAENLPAVADGRAMQLWIQSREAKPVSLAVFRPDENGRLFVVIPLQEAMNTGGALIINEGPAGGSPHPTSPPQWTAQIRQFP
jgi:hypothetical protein